MNLDPTLSTKLTGFYNVDESGQRFLRSPIREIYRKITFQDLGKALYKTLSYQLKGKRTQLTEKGDCESTPILPESILKKAEEDRDFSGITNFKNLFSDL